MNNSNSSSGYAHPEVLVDTRETEMIKDNAVSLNTDGNAKGKWCIS
jgi:hypothetical protein